MYAESGSSVQSLPNFIDLAETTANEYDLAANKGLDVNNRQNHYGVAPPNLQPSDGLTKRALIRPINTCPPPSTFVSSSCDRAHGFKAYSIACNAPIAFINGECGPEEVCVDMMAQWGRALCFSHEHIFRFIQASNLVTEKYATSGLGQLGVKWKSEALGSDLYIKGVHPEL